MNFKKILSAILIGFSLSLALPINIQPSSFQISFTIPIADAAVRVKGHFRKGKYVKPHYRSNPDGNPFNNWSFPGNTNPYTGKTATGDPDTYLKNYYDKDSSNTRSSTIPYSKSTSTNTDVSEISVPNNARLNYFGTGWICNHGYKKNYSTNECDNVDIPLNAKLNYFGDDWVCDRGYKKNYSTNTCDKISLPKNSSLNYFGDDWTCNRGYKKNYITSTCDEIILPANAQLDYFGTGWVCKPGFIKDYYTNTCN